jgi:NitT/TauT family transport system permease protein
MISPKERPSTSDPSPGVRRESAGRVQVLRSSSTYLMLLVIAALIGLWALVASRTASYVLPSPQSIARELVTNPMLYVRHAGPTALETVLGFFLGSVIAIFGAVVFVFSTSLRKALYPVAVGVNSVPIVAISPLLVIALGTGLTTKVVITTLISYFPTLIAMTRGLTSIEPEAIEYFQTLGAGPVRTLLLLRWPASLPNLFVGLRIAASSCVISAVIAEWVSADKGLGYLIITASREFEIVMMWTAVVSATILALLAFCLVVLAERWALRGRPETG